MEYVSRLTDYYAIDNLLMVALFASVCAFAVGFLLDRIFQEITFGAIGNGFLILMGIGVAMAIAPDHFHFISNDETKRIAILASAIATGLILGLGLLKVFLRRIII